MATKLNRAPAPDPYSYENPNDDDEIEFTDDEEEYENFSPDVGVPNEPSRLPGVTSRAAPPVPNQAGGPPALPPRRVDDVGSQKPSGGSFATTNPTPPTGVRPLPGVPPGSGRPTPSKNAKQLPTASLGEDDEESYEVCGEAPVTSRQGRPLPAVPPNVPTPVKAVGAQRPMPQPNTRSLEKQFSSDDDSYEVCTDVPASRQLQSAAPINRGLPPPIPDYHAEEDYDAEYVQADDDVKVKPSANVVNKGRVPPFPAVNRAQNKVNNSFPALPNRPGAAKPPAVTPVKETKQAPSVDEDIAYETGEFYTPMDMPNNDSKTSGKKPFAAVNKMAAAPAVPEYHGDDESDDDAAYVLPEEDNLGKAAAKAAGRGKVPAVPGEVRGTQPKVHQAAPALPNRPSSGNRPPAVIQKKDMRQSPAAVCDDESSEYLPMDQSSSAADKPPTKITGFRLPPPAKVDSLADFKNKTKVGMNIGSPAAATSGPPPKVFGKPAENNRPPAKDLPTVGNVAKKPETSQPGNSDTGIDTNLLLNMRKNLKTVSQSNSPKSDADPTFKKVVTPSKTTEAPPPVAKPPPKVPVPVPQVKQVSPAVAESSSPQISKSTATKYPAPPYSAVKLQPNKVEEEPDDVAVAAPPPPPPVNGPRGRMSPSGSSGHIDTKPIGHVVPRVQTPDSSAAATSRPLPVPPPAEKTNKKESLYSQSWYSGDISRKDAELKLRSAGQDGHFLIRKSAKGDPNNPYSISVFFNNYIYNLHVRLRPDRKFAIGTEKPDELVFSSVAELVNFYKNNTLEVIGDPRRNIASGKVLLLTS